MMAHLWRQLRDQATLAATAPAELDAAVKAAAAEAMKKLRADRPGAIDGRFEALEAARLERLAHEWLALERTRRPFTVVFREETMTLSAGNLRLRGRVDRMDRLEEGGLAVIDYKSGQASVASWFGDRPDDVQLPLYALAAEEDVSAVAFARLKVGELRFLGVARDEGLLPDVPSVAAERSAKKAGTWEKLLDLWRDNIARLGEDFASGDAAVDPKRLLVTCERCDLKPLCRVHERLGALAEAEEPLDEDESE
jgi:RecB family exonuclease